MRSVNLLHNDLLGCNYCDISSPHNAMHSSSNSTQTFEKQPCARALMETLITLELAHVVVHNDS